MKYILIATLFISCNNISFNNSRLPILTEPLDTIQSLPTSIVAIPEIFETAFHKNMTHQLDKTVRGLYGVTIGKLQVSSGRIIACDPMHIDEYGKPFNYVFPIGEFPVQLSIVKYEEKEVIAFARIHFSDEPVVRWEFALLQGQSPIPMGQEKRYGYSVDAGVGVFIDQDANKALDFKKMVANSDGAVYQAMDSHYRNDWRFALYNFGNHNLAAFTSGEGDGYYSTYIGFDAKGNPCRLLTDFNIIDPK